jgi:hypothetical protein
MKQYNHTLTKDLQDPMVSEKIELFIQQSENVTIPAIVFEYLSKDNTDFEANDLRNFYEQFGEIEDFELNGKISVVLFKLFFAANTCREFLQNEHNFKDNMKKDFRVRWFNLNEDYQLISEESQIKYEEISNKNSINLKQNNLNVFFSNGNNNNMMKNINNQIFINNNNTNNININQNEFINQNIMNMNMGMNIMNQNNSMNIQNMYFNGMINQNMNGMINQNMNNNNIYNQNFNMNNNMNNNKNYMMNNNGINEEKTYGKFTCKYEILIQNDKEFQIARRLIGSKGCNMKKIIDECKILDKSNINNTDNVKLRLRGKGSGYKEGPQNKESDEPLHLCISAKNQEGMKKACECVNELLNKIYEDYKKYCIKNGITPINKIAQKIDNGNSIHNKGNLNLFH